MPLRLPVRRRMGPEAVPFRRRAPPTRQATRLMRVSLGAGLLLLAVLAVQFIPRALESPQAPVVAFAHEVAGDTIVVTVTRVSVLYALSSYRGELNITDGATHLDFAIPPGLAPGASQYGGNVTFTDEDGDGKFSEGDTFEIRKQDGTWMYRLLVYHDLNDANRNPPCPCAAGRAEFTA